jgi:outer membrane lipoprotein-sorting protein
VNQAVAREDAQGDRKSGRRRGQRTGALAAVTLALWPVAAARAQDAAAIMQKMASAYQQLSSYEGTATVDSDILYQGKVVPATSLTAALKCKRPNKLTLTMQNRSGTRLLYNDGVNFTSYDALHNQYARAPAAPTMPALLPLLFARGQVVAALDPLYFFCEGRLPKALTGLKSGGSANLNGHTVFLISGVTQTQTRQVKTTEGKFVTIPASSRSWKWWIDKDTYMIRRVETLLDTTARDNVRENGKVVQKLVPVTQRIRHTVVDYKLNGNLPDSAFAFTVPAGATELKSVADLLKSGK